MSSLFCALMNASMFLGSVALNDPNTYPRLLHDGTSSQALYSGQNNIEETVTSVSLGGGYDWVVVGRDILFAQASGQLH
jgi:hypothetical protein